MHQRMGLYASFELTLAQVQASTRTGKHGRECTSAQPIQQEDLSTYSNLFMLGLLFYVWLIILQFIF